METILIILLTIIIIATLLAMSYFILYNKIQFSKIRIEQAETVILGELKNRYDPIIKCKKAIE